MKSLWNDHDARKAKTRLGLLAYRSRLIGREPKLCVWGGGNTSTKTVERDHLGRSRRVLRVKGSGSDLKVSTPQDFPPVAIDDLLALLSRKNMTDEDMVAYVKRCVLDPGAPRPSIEVLLHAFVDQMDIDHTHADAILSITNTKNGKQIAKRIYGDELIWVPYVKPGFTLAKRMLDAYRKSPSAKGAILEKHGLITWGPDSKTSYTRTIQMITRAEQYLTRASRKRKVWNPQIVKTLPKNRADRWLSQYLPVIRSAVSRRQSRVLVLNRSLPVLEFVNARDAAKISQVGPATPDHMLRTKRVPLFVKVPGRHPEELTPESLKRQIELYARSHARYFKRFKRSLPKGEYSKMLDPYPCVFLIPGIGMVTSGSNLKKARIVSEIYEHSISVMTNGSTIDRYESLSERLAFEIEYWPLELYKLSLAPKESEFSGKIGLVTGAGRGIGSAIAKKLAALGANVYLADLNLEAVTQHAATINSALKDVRTFPLRMDVTDASSVRSCFDKIVLGCGGLDFVVSNAGIAHVSSVEDLAQKDWDRSLAVNATGHFLVAREAVGILKRQDRGGALVFIASKNVLAPGKNFGAYSAAKAAESQLARILAIENGEFGIRVNMINPDGVFEDSGLWERIRGERAKSYGISGKKLETYYQNRNLMKARILPEDVAESVAFFISSRSAKTTGCILTVDGGVKEAFPR